MKNVVSIILALFLVISAVPVYASGIDLATMTDDELQVLQEELAAEIAQRKPAATSAGEGEALAEGDFDNLYVAILGAEMSKNYNGDDCLVVSIEWSHTEDSAQSFTFEVSAKAFQNGVECEKGMMVDGVDSGENLKDIKAGVTRVSKVGFVLDDLSSPVEVEVSKLIYFGNDTVDYTFELPL